MTATEFAAWLEARGLSDQAAAPLLAASRMEVWRWRTGSRPVPRRIARIVELLQIISSTPIQGVRSPMPKRNPGHIKVLVAVDDKGNGTVLSFTGRRERPEPDHLSDYEMFAEEILNCGRCCEDLLLGNPEVPGVHAFVGQMWYQDDEPAYAGGWSTLYPLPAI